MPKMNEEHSYLLTEILENYGLEGILTELAKHYDHQADSYRRSGYMYSAEQYDTTAKILWKALSDEEQNGV